MAREVTGTVVATAAREVVGVVATDVVGASVTEIGCCGQRGG